MAFTIALGICMAIVVISDARYYIIPNWLNLAILILYISALFLLPVKADLLTLAAGVIILFIGMAFFTLGLMGGGDVKLLAVLTLWVGWSSATLQFIFSTAIFGGVLVVIVLLLRAIVPPFWLKLCPKKTLPRILTRKQPVPYGIAIAAGFSFLLWQDKVPGL